MHPHTALVRACLLKLGSRPDMLVWQNTTGVFQTKTGGAVTVGLVGSPDIIGLWRYRQVVTIPILIECKTGNATQSKQQRAFARRASELGAQVHVVRSVEDLDAIYPP